MKEFLQQLKSSYALLIYLAFLLIFRYISNGIIFAKVGDTEFIFKNFLIYNYAFNTITFLLKLSFISLIIIGGALFYGFKIKSKQIFKTVILASFVYFIKYIAVLIWAMFNWQTYTNESLLAFNTKSFLEFKVGDTDSILSQFLKNFSFYDILFTLSLILFLKLLSGIQWKQSTKIILSTYVPAIVIYALLINLLIDF